jgi:hypothetical protein
MMCATLARVGDARAQLPVCPQPVPAQPYYTACAPGGRLVVARLLFDLAIDHLMKADSDPLRRRAGDLLRAVVSDETIEKNEALRAYLDGLNVLTLTKLDTVTGMLQLNVADESRRFSEAINLGGDPYRLTLQLPARLSGGYWRTPDVLQIAFWEGQRARVGIAIAGGGQLEAEVDCIVISTDGIRVVTGGADTPDILVLFDACG